MIILKPLFLRDLVSKFMPHGAEISALAAYGILNNGVKKQEQELECILCV